MLLIYSESYHRHFGRPPLRSYLTIGMETTQIGRAYTVMIEYMMQLYVNWITDDRWTRVRDQALYVHYKEVHGRKHCHKLPLVLSLFQKWERQLLWSSPITGCTFIFNNDSQSWSQQPQSNHHDHLAVSVIDWFHLFFSQTKSIQILKLKWVLSWWQNSLHSSSYKWI